MCTGVVSPALPLIQKALEEAGETDIGMVVKMMVVVPNLFIAMFSPIFGFLSPKVGKLRLLFFALIVYAIAGCSGSFLPTIYQIILMRVVLGISIAAILTVVTTLVADYFDGPERSSLVSMQTEDFGMYLPPSFYDGSFNDNEMSVGTRDAAHLTVSIKEMIHGLSQRRESMMDYAEESAIEFLSEADEYKACRFKLWYERHLSNLLARTDKACELLGKSGNNYYVMPVWNCIDIFMCDYRRWGREFCVKLDLEESPQNVDDLNRVRPLIDDIVRKTETEDFASGVKKKGTDVQVSDRVTTVNNYAIALSSHEN